MNLVSQNLLDRTQTGDSNLVDIPTIDSRYRAKVPIDGVGEEAVLEGQNTPFDMDSFRSRDSSRKEKVQQEQGQEIGLPASNLVVKVTQSPVISPGHWGFVLKMKSPTRAGGFTWKYSPLSE